MFSPWQAPSTGYRSRLVALAILSTTIFVSIWAYSPALDGGFYYDDRLNIVDNPAIRWDELSWDNLQSVIDSSLIKTRPVSNLSFALDHLRAGLDPRAFHLTNVLIHLAVGGALLWLCLTYLAVAFPSSRPVPAPTPNMIVVALLVGIFLVHPLNTQAVSYVVQRMTALSALFTLLAFASYLTGRHRTRGTSVRWYIAAMSFGLLAIGSKEIGILILPLILLYELCFFRGYWRKKAEVMFGGTWTRRWTRLAWSGVIVVTLMAAWLLITSTDIVRFSSDFPGRDFNGIERLMTQTRVQIFHLTQLIWPAPVRLNLDHDFPVSRGILDPATTLPAIIVCLALIGSSIYLAIHRPRFGFPVVAYFLLHSIEAGPIGLEIIYEHRMYLPSALLALCAATFLTDISFRRPGLLLMLLTASLLVLASWTHERNEVWADPLELRRDMAEKSPNKARAQHNFALALFESGNSRDALPIIQSAREADVGNAKSLKVLGDILLDLDRPAEAEVAYRKALQVEPGFVGAVFALGDYLAIEDEEVALNHYVTVGTELGMAGEIWPAIAILQRAVDLWPGDADGRNALGSAYLSAGMHEPALEQFRAAIASDPGKFEAWYNLGLTADRLGKEDEALRGFQGFVEHAPPELQHLVVQAKARIDALQQGGADP